MIVPMPKSAWYACRYHIAAKSPVVQPTRHRNVFTPARRHVARHDQKARDSTGSSDPGVVRDVLFVHSYLRRLLPPKLAKHVGPERCHPRARASAVGPANAAQL